METTNSNTSAADLVSSIGQYNKQTNSNLFKRKKKEKKVKIIG